jgi:hypothetical protein
VRAEERDPVADTVRPKEACTLKHQANLGEQVDEVELEAGEELVVLREWDHHYLVKNRDGKLFNVRKELVEQG